MTDYLKHTTPEEIRTIGALSDGTYSEWIKKSRTAGRFSDDWEGSRSLDSALTFMRMKDYNAFIELIVTMWIGRGDCSPRDFASEVAKASRSSFRVDYVVNKSGSLGKQLETGLWALGYPSDIRKEWMDEYRMQRWSHGDADHVNDGPPHTRNKRPVYTIDMFGAEENSIQYLTVDEALNLITLGWQSEDRIEKMGIPARIELVALYDYGNAQKPSANSWEEALEQAINLYTGDPGGNDMAWMVSQSPEFSNYISLGLTRLGLIPPGDKADQDQDKAGDQSSA